MQKINPNTSYSELKNMVPDRTNDTTPKGKSLLKSDEPILISVKENEATITIYANGFFAYQNDQGRATARAIHNCSTMYFPKADGCFQSVPEDVYGYLPFPIVLAHFGERNIEDQVAKENARKQAVSLDGDHKETKELQTPDFADAVCERLCEEEPVMSEKFSVLMKVLEHLTEAQISVAKLVYGKKKTQKETSKLLGISERGVRYHLEAIEKKLKKFEKTTS